MKTKDLTGPALDWAVAKCEGGVTTNNLKDYGAHYSPSTNWGQGGQIIEREKISLIRCDDDYAVDKDGYTTTERIPVWFAELGGGNSTQEDYGSQGDYYGECFHISTDGYYGQTPLIAAMRCYVASKLGDEIEIPEELIA